MTGNSVKFCVGDRTGPRGYCWVLKKQNSDTLLVPAHTVLSGIKVILHAGRQDEAPINFAYVDYKSRAAVQKAGGAYVGMSGVFANPTGKRPVLLGRKITSQARHLVRMRWSWDMFRSEWPSAPAARLRVAQEAGGLLPTPARLGAVDVDIYLSERRPFYPNKTRILRDNAVVAAVPHGSRFFVTAIAVGRRVVSCPTPPAMRAATPPTNKEDAVRTVNAAFDELGVLWINEVWESRAWLDAQRSEWSNTGTA